MGIRQSQSSTDIRLHESIRRPTKTIHDHMRRFRLSPRRIPNRVLVENTLTSTKTLHNNRKGTPGDCPYTERISINATWRRSKNLHRPQKSYLSNAFLGESLTMANVWNNSTTHSFKYLEGEKNVLADCFSRLPQMKNKITVGEKELGVIQKQKGTIVEDFKLLKVPKMTDDEVYINLTTTETSKDWM